MGARSAGDLYYFASIPFLILSIGICFDPDSSRFRVLRFSAFILISLFALIMFIVFFPYAAGIGVPAGWLNIGRLILHVYY